MASAARAAVPRARTRRAMQPYGRALLLAVLWATFAAADLAWSDRLGRSCESYGAVPSRCLSAGFYRDAAGQDAKAMCCACGGAPAGFSCDGAAQIACPVGYKCAGSNSRVECAAGTWCPPGSVVESACTAPAGRYCPQRSSTATGILCPAGSYCTGGGAVPLPCRVQPGFYCPLGSKAASPGVACSVGHYCPGFPVPPCPAPPTATSSTPAASTPAPTTSPTPELNTTTTTPSPTTTTPSPSTMCTSINVPCQVPEGFYCESGLAAESRTKCPRGSYCAGGASAPGGCPANTYAQTQGCLPCPSLTRSRAGSSDITDCRCIAGHTGPLGGPCTPCAAGTYKFEQGAVACEACGAGSFNTLDAATSCRACGAGKYTQSFMGIPTGCIDCAPSGYGEFGESSTCACPIGEGAKHTAYNLPNGGFLIPSVSSTLNFRDFVKSCVSQRQGCAFYDANPGFCTGDPIPSSGGYVYVAEFQGNCTGLDIGAVCAFEAQQGEMKCTQLPIGVKCARHRAPADGDARFSCCGCGGGIGIAKSAAFSLGPVPDLQMVWTGFAPPGFVAQFFRLGSSKPVIQMTGPGADAVEIPYLSQYSPHVDFHAIQDFPAVDPALQSHWFRGRWTGIIDVVDEGMYNFSCTSTHACSLWIGNAAVISAAQQDETRHVRTAWGERRLVTGPHPFLAEISPFQVSGFLRSAGSKWEYSWHRPAAGTELNNAELAAALQQRDEFGTGEYEFSTEELIELDLHDVSHGSWIQIGEKYFRPSGSSPQPVDVTVTWRGPRISSSTRVSGYHKVATHECSGKCTKCTTCPVGYRINGTLCTGKGFKDLQSDCVKCTTSCPPGYFLNTTVARCDGTETYDRVCQRCKDCPSGSYIQPGTACTGMSTSDSKICRTCTTQCEPGQYVVLPDDGHACNGTGFEDSKCMACKQCKPGQYRNSTWVACNGTSNQYVDTQVGCQNCTADCGLGNRFVRGECTGYEFGDRPCEACGSCPTGTYRTPEWKNCSGTGTVDTQRKCHNCSSLSCGEGNYRWVEPHKKTVKGAWVNGVWKYRYWDGISWVESRYRFDREGMAWAVCDGTGYYDSQAECAPCKSACSSGERIAPACTGVETNDRACTKCVLCESGKYRSRVYKECNGVTVKDTQSSCEDDPLGWHDKDGPDYNCKWYEEEDRCQKFGSREDLRNQGKVAKEACCACGGGLKTCLPCRQCAMGTFIGSTPCDGTTYSDMSSCEMCISSCQNGSYVNTTEPCDGTGYRDRQCANCTRNCEEGYFLNTSLTTCNGHGTEGYFCQALASPATPEPFVCAQGEYIVESRDCLSVNRTCANCTGGATYWCGQGNFRLGPICDGTGAYAFSVHLSWHVYLVWTHLSTCSTSFHYISCFLLSY